MVHRIVPLNYLFLMNSSNKNLSLFFNSMEQIFKYFLSDPKNYVILIIFAFFGRVRQDILKPKITQCAYDHKNPYMGLKMLLQWDKVCLMEKFKCVEL